MTQNFGILTVCTGNICRSPVAAQLLMAGTADVADITVGSAGTMALVGKPMPDQAQALSRQLGADPTGHEPTYLTEGIVARANLVFAMSREHRAAIVQLWPKASRYTFTVREFARLAEGLTEWDFVEIAAIPSSDHFARLTALIELIAARRGSVELPLDPEDDDVIDPYRQSESVYQLSGQQILPAVQTALRVIRLTLAVEPA